MTEFDFEIGFDIIIEDLVHSAEELGFSINVDDVCFDDSRSWSLYVCGDALDLPVEKFGAYRNYLGGGIRGGICSNGRENDGTMELAELFKKALEKIENLYNTGYEEAEDWELPTGVLL